MRKDIDAPDPADADRRRFVVIPWDLDTSFGGHYAGDYYDGNYADWPVNVIMNNAQYPISYLAGDVEYLAILKQRWVEGRRGAFSGDSVCKKLERYRDLFIESGAWQRMTEHFDAAKACPMYVHDLAHEIECIEEWYKGRFAEMDAYFGIEGDEDGIEVVKGEGLMVHGECDDRVYNMSGQLVTSCKLPKGFYIVGGKKYVVQ